MDNKKHNFFLILILSLGLFLRTIFITSTPLAITNDEIDYLLLAKAAFYQGTDLTGTQTVWSLRPAITETATSELGFLFQLPVMAFLPSGQATAKIMPVIFSTLLIWAVYLLVDELWHNRRLALIASFLMAVNPWAIFIGRTAYEAPIALTLFTASFYLLCLLSKKRESRQKVFIFIAWLLVFGWAFFTYHGLKIAGVGLTILLVIYLLAKNKTKFDPWLLTASFIALAILLVNSVSLVQNQTRMGEISLFNTDAFIQESDKRHRLNLVGTSWLSKALDSRYLIFLNETLVKYWRAYDWQILFFSGERGWNGGVSNYGQFHFWELGFLALGVYFLGRHRKWRELLLFSGALLISPVAIVVATLTTQATLRQCFLIVIFAIVMAYGLMRLQELTTSATAKKLVMLSLVGIYGMGLLLWGHNYYHRYPLYAEEQWNFRDRLLSRYLSLTSQPVTIITDKPYSAWRNYLFYNNLYTRENSRSLSAQFLSDGQDKHWENLTFSNDCQYAAEATHGATVVVAVEVNCSLPETDNLASAPAQLIPEIDIVAIKDSGTNYRIYNDEVCQNFYLKSFFLTQDRNNFKLENMEAESFCRQWLVRYFN